MSNDSGKGIKVLTVQEPTNGETLQGRVKLIDTTVYYYSPSSTDDAPITADHFGYTIEDIYGQKAKANVRVVFPADIPAALPTPSAFVGPYTCYGLGGFTNAEYPVVMYLNLAHQMAEEDFYGPDIVVIGTINNYNGVPIILEAGWSLGKAHVQGKFTMYEVHRVFTKAEWIAAFNGPTTIPLLKGIGSLPNGGSPPVGITFDLWAWTCPGVSTESLLQHFEVTSFDSSSHTVNFPNYGAGIVYLTTVYGMLNTDVGPNNPIRSVPANKFIGYDNDFRASFDGYNDLETPADNGLNGLTVAGQDAGFTCNRVFKAYYKSNV
jgi:hypothetical protein